MNYNFENTLNNKKGNCIMYFIIIAFVIAIVGSFYFIFFFDSDENNNIEHNNNMTNYEENEKMLIYSIDNMIVTVVSNNNDNNYGSMFDATILYYVPVSNVKENSCIQLERGVDNPLGSWNKAYVAVLFNPDEYSFSYYFTFNNKSGYGMTLTEQSKINYNANLIKKPIPDDATDDKITKQLVGSTTSSLVLLTPAEAEKLGVEACSITTAKKG